MINIILYDIIGIHVFDINNITYVVYAIWYNKQMYIIILYVY